MRERISIPQIGSDFLWFHGASLGECKMLLALIKCLKKDIPQLPKILITTQKKEVLDFLRNKEPSIKSQIAPIDNNKILSRFLERLKPRALILAENELWPSYLSETRKRNIPVALISGRYYNSLPHIKSESIQFLAMQNECFLKRFLLKNKLSYSCKTFISGDWKILPYLLNSNEVVNTNRTIDYAFISIHYCELKNMLFIFDEILKNKKQIIVIPRKLEEVNVFQKFFKSQKINFTKWPIIEKNSISIVQKFGQVSAILSQSKNAIVGGSFHKKLGIHNFWEPLFMGCSTWVGPYIKGQKENAQPLLEKSIIKQIYPEFLKEKNDIEDNFKMYFENQKNNLLNAYDALQKFIKSL